MRQHGGNIVNISSVGGLRAAHPVMGPYDISKSALIHLTSQLAAELAPTVRVNAVAPGLVRTEFSRSAWENGQGYANMMDKDWLERSGHAVVLPLKTFQVEKIRKL
jgi:NAD(P)-dependent dehydrogenase (short-subunit alcohol dehydrogenase family)